MFVCCECCVLSGRGLYDEPITRPEESYRLWCVVVCDLETSGMSRTWPNEGCRAKINMLHICRGMRWRSWLRHCAKRRKVSGSISDGVIGIFH